MSIDYHYYDDEEQPLLPDLGTALAQGGLKPDEHIMLPQFTIGRITKIKLKTGIEFTAEAVIEINEDTFVASIDFLIDHLQYMLNGLQMLGNEDLARHIAEILLKDMEQVNFQDRPINLLATVKLANVEESAIGEPFIPLRIMEINAVAAAEIDE